MVVVVVDVGVDFVGRVFVVFEEFVVGFVEGVGEDFGFGVVLCDVEVFEVGGEGEEFVERILVEEVFFGELLDVFWGGVVGVGFEEVVVVYEGNDGEYFGVGVDFEDWEEVGEVVVEDVVGDVDGVLFFDDVFEGDLVGFGGWVD